MSGGCEILRSEDIRSIVSDPHLGIRAADEFTEQHGQGAEESWNTESTNKLQSTPRNNLNNLTKFLEADSNLHFEVTSISANHLFNNTALAAGSR